MCTQLNNGYPKPAVVNPWAYEYYLIWQKEALQMSLRILRWRGFYPVLSGWVLYAITCILIRGLLDPERKEVR